MEIPIYVAIIGVVFTGMAAVATAVVQVLFAQPQARKIAGLEATADEREKRISSLEGRPDLSLVIKALTEAASANMKGYLDALKTHDDSGRERDMAMIATLNAIEQRLNGRGS